MDGKAAQLVVQSEQPRKYVGPMAEISRGIGAHQQKPLRSDGPVRQGLDVRASADRQRIDPLRAVARSTRCRQAVDVGALVSQHREVRRRLPRDHAGDVVLEQDPHSRRNLPCVDLLHAQTRHPGQRKSECDKHHEPRADPLQQLTRTPRHSGGRRIVEPARVPERGSPADGNDHTVRTAQHGRGEEEETARLDDGPRQTVPQRDHGETEQREMREPDILPHNRGIDQEDRTGQRSRRATRHRRTADARRRAEARAVRRGA